MQRRRMLGRCTSEVMEIVVKSPLSFPACSHPRYFGSSFANGGCALRQRQLDLALDADISTRHLSFVETGRSATVARHGVAPGRRAECARCAIAMYCSAPPASRRSFRTQAGRSAPCGSARKAVDLVLKGHEPYPALAIDRHWTLTAANDAVPPLLAGASAEACQTGSGQRVAAQPASAGSQLTHR